MNALPQIGITSLIAACVAAVSVPSAAQDMAYQGWKPEHPVEIIVACGPGCGPDTMARLMQRVFQTRRWFDPAVTVQNKVGGGGTLSRGYLNQHEGNGHYLLAGDKGMIGSHIMGRGGVQYTDITPVAVLFGEYIGLAVRTDSPIRSGRDLIDRLRKDPAAHSFGIAAALGNVNHQSVAGALKSEGVDVRRMRTVTFSSGALAVAAMLGGHIDAVPVSAGVLVPHLKAGAVRVIAVSSAERLPGDFAAVPTWREQGANAVTFNWRAMFGPKGMTPAQVAYWEGALKRVLDTPEWAAEMTLRHAVPKFMDAATTRKLMDEEYVELKTFLAELNLAKN